MDIILASKSPRRRELLRLIGLPFTAMESDVEENASELLAPDEYVKTLAFQKADAVFQKHPDACVIGSDTIVYLDGKIIGKPRSEEDAFRILKLLQGNRHLVYTGVSVITPDCSLSDAERTEVTFWPMTDEEIHWYMSTGEPFDKAGAYGVQGPGGVFVKEVSGNYFNVVGLPLPLLYHLLQKAGVLFDGLQVK